jgi:hypothetical protein
MRINSGSHDDGCSAGGYFGDGTSGKAGGVDRMTLDFGKYIGYKIQAIEILS